MADEITASSTLIKLRHFAKSEPSAFTSADDETLADNLSSTLHGVTKGGDFLEDIHDLDVSNDLLLSLEGNKEFQCRLKAFEAVETNCPDNWDGVLCWPSTPPGIQAVLKCFEELKGIKYDSTQNATRLCLDNGHWANYTNYTSCTESEASNFTATAPADVTSLIYLGGYSLSLVALMLAVFIFLYFKDLRCLRNTIHTNLMCTYILAGCIWILNLTLQMSAQADNASCMILVLCLHYFYLTNFFWMLVEGLYLYMLVVETFTSEKIKLKVYASIGWGLPGVFIIIWVIVRSLTPIEIQKNNTEMTLLILGMDGMFDVGRIPVCIWMREHSCDWIYKGPAMAGLAINLLFLISIMWVLITKLRSANTLETEQYRKATKALLVLIPLLGITYILVLIGPTEGWSRVCFDYARAILLSTQGFTVALFYCFLNTEVQNTIKHHVDRWKARRSIGGGNRYHCSYSKDWSPRTRTESIRLNSQPHGNHKRESTASETTTMTMVGPSQRHSVSANRNSLAPSPAPHHHQNNFANNQENSPLTNGQHSTV